MNKMCQINHEYKEDDVMHKCLGHILMKQTTEYLGYNTLIVYQYQTWTLYFFSLMSKTIIEQGTSINHHTKLGV